MAFRKSRSKKLAALDAELEARHAAIIAGMHQRLARVRELAEESKLKSQAARLAKEPDYWGVPTDDVVKALKARIRGDRAETVADRRAAKVEELSLLRVPARKIAEQLGLSYYYVIELRRKLGVSRARPRRK